MRTVDISVRLTEDARDNLERICREHGVSRRAVIEAIFLCFLGPSEEAIILHDAVWDTARRIDAEAATGQSERVRANARIDYEILLQAKAACGRHGVSVNALAATAFTRWGSGWGDGQQYEARDRLFERALEVARRFDYERRTGRRSNGSPVCLAY